MEEVINMEKNIEELTLLLMYLTSWEEEGLCYDEDDNLRIMKIISVCIFYIN